MMQANMLFTLSGTKKIILFILSILICKNSISMSISGAGPLKWIPDLNYARQTPPK